MPDLSYEKQLWGKGVSLVGGIDEVGRGCLAGPLFASVVVFPVDIEKKLRNIKVKIDDSKKLTPLQRLRAYEWIEEYSTGFVIKQVSASFIDENGIVKATNKVFKDCVLSLNEKLLKPLEIVLIDAFNIKRLRGYPVGNKKLNEHTRQFAISKGDNKVFSIAAASIVAKVERDRYMAKLSTSNSLEQYGWATNKGYGTKQHKSAIQKYGITNYHRRSFLKNNYNSYLD